MGDSPNLAFGHYEKNEANTLDITKDFLQGDISLDKSYLKDVDFDQIYRALNFLLNNPNLTDAQKAALTKRSWSIVYRRKPPTIEEFLTPKYLGRQAADGNIYPRVHQVITEFLDPNTEYRNLILSPFIGFGKELENSSKVMTPSGYTCIGDIKVGDDVSAPDGSVTQVSGVFPQGVKPLYKITFSDGRSVVAGLDHQWKAAKSKRGRDTRGTPYWQTITTRELLDDLEAHPKARWFIPMTKPVHHERQDHVLPPYTMGALLGDGHFGTTNDKFIPQEYLYDSVENRIALLQGLMDTDGTAVKRSGQASFYTVSPQLRDDLMFLVRGLGGRCTYSEDSHKRAHYETSRTGYIIHILFPTNDFPIFSIKRKQAIIDSHFNRSRVKKKTQHLYIQSIEFSHEAPATCIQVDHPDKLFLTDDYIVTHNSTAAVIITLYIATLLSFMRDPKKYFNQAPSAVLCQALISYSLKKSSEVLLEPYMNILDISDFFEKVHTREGMVKKDKEFEEMGEDIDRVFWTTAVPTSALQFSNGANIKMISSVQNLLGLTIITAVLSELSFFRDAGKSDQYILRIYNDTKGRIESRMKGNWFGRSILDSSPDSFDNPIDSYIWGEAKKDPTNYIVTGSRWEWEEEEFQGDEKFPVYLGGPGKPPAILQSTEGYDVTDLLWVPEKLRTYFQNDLVKAIKDIGGRPSGNMSKLLYDTSHIENMFDDRLNNIYTHLHVPSYINPDGAIWDQVYKSFFREAGGGLRFYYRPEIPRVFSVDQSENDDTTCISIAHHEMLNDGSVLYVFDMTLILEPIKNDINLDAIRYFIRDLHTKGNMNFIEGSFDQYQSAPARQFLERELNIPVRKLSVDRSMEPYRNLVSDIRAGRAKVGKNIYIKNNLKSLTYKQRKGSKSYKVDHTLGDKADPFGDTKWETSLIGIHAKDATDAMAANSELLRQAGAPLHYHNDFEELRYIDAIVEDEDEYKDFLASNRGLRTTSVPWD